MDIHTWPIHHCHIEPQDLQKWYQCVMMRTFLHVDPGNCFVADGFLINVRPTLITNRTVDTPFV